MTPNLQSKMQDQLNKWLVKANRQPAQPEPKKQLIEVKGHVGKARKLHSYKALVEFTPRLGGGTAMYKSVPAIERLISEGCKVVWI